MKIETAFTMAAAQAGKRTDQRAFRLAALGVRGDGAVVCSTNLPAIEYTPACHAEYRLAAKLSPNSTVFVVRIGRGGEYRMARPCRSCLLRLVRAGATRIYYSIADREHGVIKI